MKYIFHPKAFLSHKRNIKTGLNTRTLILQVLEEEESNIKRIKNLKGLSYNVVHHHMRLLEAEHIVVKKSEKKPYFWQLTGIGQQRLLNRKQSNYNST